MTSFATRVSTSIETISTQIEQYKNPSPTLFATMLALNTNDGLRGLSNGPDMLEEGWSTIIADKRTYTAFVDALEQAFEKNGARAKSTGFSSNRDVVGAFVWNVIEPTKGTYDWTIPDITVQSANEADMTLSAVIQPFATWDQVTTSEEAYRASCAAIDFGYYDYRAGPVTDMNAYHAFVTAVVERYDGDGINDMPGLSTRVEAWEIGNEIEGPCGGFYNKPDAYIDVLRTSYDAINTADDTALVLNGGALEIAGFGAGPEASKQFWKDFFAAGGDAYLDVFNFHYNRERGGAQSTSESWETHLTFFNELMENSQGKKPLWVTEFGTYAGTPQLGGAPGQPRGGTQTLTTQTEAFQAAWYFRYAVIGFSQGLERIFIDLQGSGNTGIGGASYFHQGPGVDGTARAFLATTQAIDRALNGFEHVERIAEGQYIFRVDDQDVFALWNGELPDALTGKTITRVEIDGTETVIIADQLDFSKSSPVLVTINN